MIYKIAITNKFADIIYISIIGIEFAYIISENKIKKKSAYIVDKKSSSYKV